MYYINIQQLTIFINEIQINKNVNDFNQNNVDTQINKMWKTYLKDHNGTEPGVLRVPGHPTDFFDIVLIFEKSIDFP